MLRDGFQFNQPQNKLSSDITAIGTDYALLITNNVDKIDDRNDVSVSNKNNHVDSPFVASEIPPSSECCVNNK